MRAQTKARSGASAIKAPQIQKYPPHRILVLEEEPDIRQLETEVLKKSGYRVDFAESSHVALQLLRAGRYDLLIVEDELAFLTGREFITQLRAKKLSVPVILVMGTMPDTGSAGIHWPHIDAVLVKPYTVAELLRTVKGALLCKVHSGALGTTPPSNWQDPIYRQWCGELRIH